jgi:4-hydroxyproline epimerase
MADRLGAFRSHHDRFRSAVVNEPRGSDVVVGALLCEPDDQDCVAGAIFFNNVGYLGMCGHGTIGLVTTLAWLGRIKPGRHGIETPVGKVATVLHADGSVAVENVRSYRRSRQVAVSIPDYGVVHGDVAWGGNWFFLVTDPQLDLSLDEVPRLTEVAWKIRQAVNVAGFPEVDHVELFGAPASSAAHARNFVLCPGKAYDRSPCGTGTCAKLACLAADEQWEPGQVWVQESILGTIFECSYQWDDATTGRIVPTIRGSAHIIADSQLLLDDRDPFCWGIRAGRARE